MLLLDKHLDATVTKPVPGMLEAQNHTVSAQVASSRTLILYQLCVKVIRSASDWSVGYDSVGHDWVENSVHQSYLHEIMSAERFIYIENQFFISSTANPSLDKNGDGEVSAHTIMMHCDSDVHRLIISKWFLLKLRKPWGLI